ncbi:SDR family NAD(P)-dependent oxidoreductase [Paraburkholderia caribensis]|uniref:SDR family NAD(P)-dependent oxidoreductase n=1 Tax=Paraburkholderia TaxID=1822464 RepID=UPI00159242E5|nr:SDR family NAD(P)-dependent oxidoreductase [Paraburkholderia caribensis]BEU25645.1 SDR family NAD(P)-dependent oxidoreductase [Paraburkholderia sp. 22B1P]CAG9262421.1 3-oxoacyl-ACP reductase [Paraburkholderia caribensis]
MSVEKVAVVTGAGSGVGAETASRLHGKGFAVMLLDIDGKAAEGQAQRLDPSGETARAWAVDVRDREAVAKVIAQIDASYHRIDVLVNNAGLPQTNLPFEVVDAEAWTRILDVNVAGIVNLCAAVSPTMRGRKAGRIVNVTSVSGLRARPGMSAYCAAKAAANSLTQTLALEFAADGVLVNAIAPGSLNTPMFERFLRPDESWDAAMARYLPQIPLNRLGEPGEIADAIVWVAAEAPGFMTGQVITIDGGRSLS